MQDVCTGRWVEGKKKSWLSRAKPNDIERTIFGCNHDSTILHRAVGGLKHIQQRTVNHSKKRIPIQSLNQFSLHLHQMECFVESPLLPGHQSAHTFANRKSLNGFWWNLVWACARRLVAWISSWIASVPNDTWFAESRVKHYKLYRKWPVAQKCRCLSCRVDVPCSVNLPCFLALYPTVTFSCCTVTFNGSVNVYSTLKMQVSSLKNQLLLFSESATCFG